MCKCSNLGHILIVKQTTNTHTHRQTLLYYVQNISNKKQTKTTQARPNSVWFDMFFTTNNNNNGLTQDTHTLQYFGVAREIINKNWLAFTVPDCCEVKIKIIWFSQIKIWAKGLCTAGSYYLDIKLNNITI